MTITKVLMCPPTYFDIEYSINPWMDVNNKADKGKAQQQWQYAFDKLKELGVDVHVMDAQPGQPDMTFVGDAGMVHNGKFLTTNFRHAERQGEVVHYVKWMKDHGYPVYEIPQEIYFEGLGDVVYYGDDIVYGFGPRSSAEAITYVRDVYPELNVLGELAIKDDSFFHLSHAIAFIDKRTLLYYPDAFTEESLQFLRDNFDRLIECSKEDATQYFVCNNIPVGNKILMDNCTPELEQKLLSWGYEVVKTDMSEFKKAGGSVRCLILSI